jgi:hypothetical protein
MLFFLDESGTGDSDIPYEVLGGVSIRERDLWNYVQAIGQLQLDLFGMRLRDLGGTRSGLAKELKAKQLLQRDKFRYASQGPPMDPHRRTDLACSFLQRGLARAKPNREEFTAYGQAVLEFVGRLLETAGRFQVKVFASMVERNAPKPLHDEMLRRDHSFLFERFFCYLEDTSAAAQGILVFDELERSQCLRVIRRMEDYFLKTENGRIRSTRIIPEPFFVHSELTTGIQTADIVCYVLNWKYRFRAEMTALTRPELAPFLDKIRPLIYKRLADEEAGEAFTMYGVTYLDDLRPRVERGEP